LQGFAASGLDGKLNRDESPYWFCWKSWDSWFNLWVAFYELLTSSCLLNNMGLVYNATSDTFANKQGVDVRARDFGGLSGVDYVDHTDDLFSWTLVYGAMIDAMEEVGFVRNVTLFGAPFDWRLHLRGVVGGEFGEAMKALVERAFNASGGKKVHIVTHSYGGVVAVYWMNEFVPAGFASQAAWHAWIKAHVASFVPIAGPFSGTAKALRSLISGDTFGAPDFLINRENMLPDVRTIGGAVQLVPDPGYWPPNKAFVITPGRNYTVTDLRDAMTDSGADVSATIFDHTKDLIDGLALPPVTTYCMYGFNYPTEISYTYDEALTDSKILQPTVIDTSDLGDGTVPLLSLLECQYWDELDPNANDVRCREYKLDAAGHADLDNAEIIADLILIGSGREPFTSCNATTLDAHIAAMPAHEMPRKAQQVRALKARNAKLAQ
jgi:hypothetical protein